MQKSADGTAIGSVYDIFRTVAYEVRAGKRKGQSEFKRKLEERRQQRIAQGKVRN